MKSHSKSSSPRAILTRSAFRSLLTLSVTAGAGLLGPITSVQAATDDIWIFSGDVNNPTATNAITGGGTANFDDGPTGYWQPTTGNPQAPTTPIVKPTANNYNAVINNGGTVNITADETPVDIIVGSIANGNGTFNQTAGTVTMSLGWFRLGTFGGAAGTGGTGAYNMSGGALNLTGGGQQYNVGDSAFSTCFNTIGGGPGTATVSGTFSTFNVAGGASSNGTLSLNAGGSFTMTTAGAGVATIGNATGSVGTLNIGGGSMTINPVGVGSFVVANAIGSNGTVNLSSGTLTFAPTVAGANNGTNTAIGSTGTANFNITGGTANFQPTAGGYPLAVGRASNSTGTITMSAGTLNVGTAAVPQEMWIGNAPGVNQATPNGTFNMSGGTTNVSSWLAVGRNTNGAGTGVLNLSGGVINAAINAGNISLSGTNAGNVGTTTVTGGSLNTPNAIYLTEGNLGTLNVSGTGVVNQFGGTGLSLNRTGTANTTSIGTVNLGDGVTAGGLISVNNVNTVNTGAARSIFNFNGGTLQAKVNNGAFFATGGTNNVRNLGARIDSNQTVITISQPLTHSNIVGDNATDGGLTKVGLGALVLASAGNTYTGNTTITAGVLDAQQGAGSVPGLNTAGRVNVGAAGALAVGVGYAAGSSVGDIDTARASNTFAPGGSIGLDIAAPAGPATYATNLTPAVTTDFYKLGAGQLFLVGANSYTGITYLQGGLLSPAIGSLGTGGFTFNGGGLQFAAGDTTDYSNRAVVFNGAATIDTNGNNVNFANPVTGLGGGQLIKQGLGSLTFNGFNFSPTRAFTPGVAGFGNVFVQAGTLTLTGATTVVNPGGNFISIGQGQGNFGTMNVQNGASFLVNADFNVADVGGITAAGNDGGILNISGTGSTVSSNAFFVGKGGNGATNGAFAVGVVNQSGGTFTANGNAQIGAFGQGQYNLTGGSYVQAGGPFLSIARQTGSFGKMDVSGTGVLNFNAPTGRLIVGELGTGVLTVRNGGVVNNNSATNASGGNLTSALAALTLGNGPASGTGILNLLTNGTVNTLSIGGLNNATTGILNFSGGTLKNTAASPTFIQNLTQANVYGNVNGLTVNGAVIDTTAGNATIAQPLIAPAGQGITSIAATGAGFSTAPIVQVTGGGGTGATALANVDATGNVTSFTVTSPGTGYTSQPTVTLTGPSGVVVTTTANIGNNVSGGLTKLGINTLTLTGVNTYTGPTTISAGTLALTGTGSIATSPLITTAGGATFSLGAATTFATTQTLTGTGTISSAANAITVNGILSPGATANAGDIGNLTIATTGTLTLSGTAVLQFDITNAATKDLLTFTGAGASLNVNGTLAIRGTVVAGTTYTLATGLTTETGNFATVTGVPANLPPTYTFTGGNYNVTFGAVPEPSTWAMGVAGLGLAAVWLRRRRVA